MWREHVLTPGAQAGHSAAMHNQSFHGHYPPTYPPWTYSPAAAPLVHNHPSKRHATVQGSVT